MSAATSGHQPIRASAGLGFAVLLGLTLLLVSFARLIGDMGSAAFSTGMIERALTDSIWRTRLALNIALFALAMLALHLAFGLLCWSLARLSETAFPAARCSRRQWTLVWFLAGALWLLLANAAQFTHSSLGESWHAMATTRVIGVTPYLLVSGGVLAGIAAVLLMFLRRTAGLHGKSYVLAAGAALVVGAGFTWFNRLPHGDPAGRPPNIILLGVDSLRPDFVNVDDAPHIQAFMDGAVQMQDAVTPLARTFPSWVSILTGRHPHTTGAFVNLLPRELIRTGDTLPETLRAHGYQTYYSMDETRFANIDASYGFDHTMTSTMGGSDFVLSWFADTPLSNVVMNTRLGALLFPHMHANRAAHVTYDPDAFVRRVTRAIRTDQPAFLVSHLTLPHWPFIWAESAATEPVESNIPALYASAVHRADRQFGDLLTALQRRGILDNAIVVALSDHGEALGHAEDLPSQALPANQGAAPKAWKWGHGTSVFSPTQYRVVLGMRAYGAARALFAQPAVRNEPVSLVDLAPTILELLKIESRESFDGVSLVSLLRSEATARGQFAERIRFTETEYNPQGFNSANLSGSALAEAMKVYRLNSATDRLVVRKEAIESILASRQYAALLGKRSMAVAMPDKQDDGSDAFVFIAAPDVRDSQSSADAARLRQALQDRYGIRFSDPKALVPSS